MIVPTLVILFLLTITLPWSNDISLASNTLFTLSIHPVHSLPLGLIPPTSDQIILWRSSKTAGYSLSICLIYSWALQLLQHWQHWTVKNSTHLRTWLIKKCLASCDKNLLLIILILFWLLFYLHYSITIFILVELQKKIKIIKVMQ